MALSSYIDKKRIPIVEAKQEGTGFLIESDAGLIAPEMNGIISEGFKYEPDKPVKLKCVLQKEGTVNKNQRIYPKEILDREIVKYKKIMERQSAVGEADHPESSNIALDNLAHRILTTYWNGNTLYGEIELLPSRGFLEQGICSMIGDKILRYLELGVTIGISSRGIGSVKNIGGKNIVQEDFELICFDLVVTPSTPNAYLFQEKEVKIDESTKKSKELITNINKNNKVDSTKLVKILKNFNKK